MLHWLAGQKQVDGVLDADATGYIEPPETPAPVFAVRAFKHAIFGTPQTAQPRQRRHSNVENARPITTDSKLARPGIGRPKSSSDAPTIAKQDGYLEVEPLSSPAKGILLSPGIGTARKKNVTFGEHVVDNEEKRPLRSGVGEDNPAKLHDSWNAPDETRTRDESPRKGAKSRTKLVDALEQVRDESKKRRSKVEKRSSNIDIVELPSKEFASPKSESGKYWKREYDIYRANTQHEVKKLITKQKAAKSFAQMKDEQCTELAAQLKQEQKKVDKLEAKSAELSLLVEDLQNQLRARRDGETTHRDELARLKATSHGTALRPNNVVMTEPLFDHYLPEGESRAKYLQRGTKNKDNLSPFEEDLIQRPSEPYNASSVSANEKQESRTHAASKAQRLETKANDDIWAQSFQTSSPVASQRADKAVVAQTTGHGASSAVGSSALQNLDLNTLTTAKAETRWRPGEHAKPNSRTETSTASSSECRIGKASDPSQLASARVSRLLSDAKASQHDLSANADSQKQESAIHSQAARAFEAGSHTRPPRDLPPLPTTAGHPKTGANSMKENVAPDGRRAEVKLKPSAVWNSMNAIDSRSRNTSITGKDGKEVSLDRIQAARARIAARSRATAGT